MKWEGFILESFCVGAFSCEENGNSKEESERVCVDVFGWNRWRPRVVGVLFLGLSEKSLFCFFFVGEKKVGAG